MWDKVEIRGELTLKQFLDYFKKEYCLIVQMINYDVVTLFSNYSDPEVIRKRHEMKYIVALISY